MLQHAAVCSPLLRIYHNRVAHLDSQAGSLHPILIGSMPICCDAEASCDF